MSHVNGYDFGWKSLVLSFEWYLILFNFSLINTSTRELSVTEFQNFAHLTGS